MTFEEPQIVLVGHAKDVVLGAGTSPCDFDNDNNSTSALDLGLDD
jgi:hypothetical protein